MPTFGANPPPVIEPDPLVDLELGGYKGGGGGRGGGGFNNPNPPFFNSGSGGSGSGGFFRSQQYSPFGGYDPMAIRRRAQMGGFPQRRQMAPQRPMGQSFRPNIQSQPMGMSQANSWGRDYGSIVPPPNTAGPYQPTPGGVAPRPGYGGTGQTRWQELINQLGRSENNSLVPEDLANLILGGYGEGWASPGGDPRIMQEYDRFAQRQGQDAERAALLGADLDHADYGERGLASTMARASAGRSRSDFFNQNRLDQSRRYQDLLQQLFLGKLSGDYTQDDDYRRARWAADSAGDQRRHESSLLPWEIAGDAAGRAAGAAAGGKGGKK